VVKAYAPGDEFGGGLACYGEMQFILDKSVKLPRRLAIPVIVVTALLEDVRDFLVGAALAGANFADTLQ
jgi:hypothetical protein